MFFLYIDDSFFSATDFSRNMRYKLSVLLEESPLDTILVSVSKTTDETVQRFFAAFDDLHVYYSTQRLMLDDKEWLLTNQSLQTEGLSIRPFAGTYCLVDTQTLQYERIYLDLFPEEETDLLSIFRQSMQEALDRISGQKEKPKS